MLEHLCEKHKKTIEILCLDSQCSETPKCCILCIKNAHKDCDSSKILTIKELKALSIQSSLKIPPKEQQNLTKIREVFVLAKFKYSQALIALQKQWRRPFKLASDSNNVDVKNLFAQKMMFAFNYNSETDRIVVSKDFSFIPDLVKSYDATHDKFIDSLASDLSKYVFSGKVLEAQNFSCKNSVKVAQRSTNTVSLEFSSDEVDLKFGIAYFRIPMLKARSFRVKFENWHAENLYEIGFSGLNMMNKDTDRSSAYGSVIGLSKYSANNLKGVSTDFSAFKDPEFEVTVAIDPAAKTVEVYDASRLILSLKTEELKEEVYYFYISGNQQCTALVSIPLE